MKTIRAKQAEVHSAYFVQRDQHGMIAKDVTVTQSSILMRRFRCSCRPSFLNSLLAISGAHLSFGWYANKEISINSLSFVSSLCLVNLRVIAMSFTCEM